MLVGRVFLLLLQAPMIARYKYNSLKVFEKFRVIEVRFLLFGRKDQNKRIEPRGLRHKKFPSNGRITSLWRLNFIQLHDPEKKNLSVTEHTCTY